jgi:hypothetical protein
MVRDEKRTYKRTHSRTYYYFKSIHTDDIYSFTLMNDRDIKADIEAADADRGEPVSLAEPLLIDTGSRFRGILTDPAPAMCATRPTTQDVSVFLRSMQTKAKGYPQLSGRKQSWVPCISAHPTISASPFRIKYRLPKDL